MLLEESVWIGKELKRISKPGERILNIGSSNLQLRKVIQPHIHDNVFKPLESLNIDVIHTDIKADEGVDLVGDLTSEEFNNQLKKLDVNCLLCSNLLEHIVQKQTIIDAMDAIISSGGYCLITVPHNYPYHMDPIDTMYRPTPRELAQLFPNYNIVKEECVSAVRMTASGKQKNYFQMLSNDPKLMLRLFTRSLFPFYKYKSWKILIGDLSSMFKDFQVSCVLLQKK